MTIRQRLKNLWKLSEMEFNQVEEKLVFSDLKSQFLEPVSFKEKFNNANNIDQLLENE